MKNFSKTQTLRLVVLAFAVACAAAPSRAQTRTRPQMRDASRPQTRDARFISASAGGINFVSGGVEVRRAGQAEWRSVSVKDDMRSGDTARTGADGRVEVLLNPGSYVRAGASTEFELVNSSLEELQLRLARGSAVVEATGYGETDLDIRIATPSTTVHIVRTGVYRLDVSPSGETVVSVQKGRALLGDGAAALLLKSGKVARVAGRVAAEVAKLDKKQRDDLDEWSRERGRELTKVNGTLASSQTNAMLVNYGISDFWRAEFPGYGIWMWSEQRRCFTFLPFFTGWRSPYGFSYGSFFSPYGYYNCYGCAPMNRQPIIVRGTTPAGAPVPPPVGSNGGGSNTPTSGGGSGGGRTLTPISPAAGSPVDRGDRPTRERTVEPGSRPINQ